MMEVSVETIYGKKCTVIRHDESDKTKTTALSWKPTAWGAIAHNPFNQNIHVATALFALRKHPEPEDAKEVNRYLAEGLKVWGECQYKNADGAMVLTGNDLAREIEYFPRVNLIDIEIIYALDERHDRVEIAIEE